MLLLRVAHSAPCYRHVPNRRTATSKIRRAVFRALVAARVFPDEESARSLVQLEFVRGTVTTVTVKQTAEVAGHGWIGEKPDREAIESRIVESVNTVLRGVVRESFHFKMTEQVPRRTTDKRNHRPSPTRRSRSRQGAGAMAR